MNRYLCPVCYYPDLDEPPGEFNICPSCGTEFGVDDYVPGGNPTDLIYRELRYRWLENGAPWFDAGVPPPSGWNGYEQVRQNSALWLRTDVSMAVPALRTTLTPRVYLVGTSVLTYA